MKKITFITLFILLFGGLIYSDTVEDYFDKKSNELLHEYMHQEELFAYSLIPMPYEYQIIYEYTEWQKKRHSKEKMVEKAQALLNSQLHKENLLFQFMIQYTGDLFSEGKTEVDFPDDLQEYIFLENDSGDYVRCNKLAGNIVEYGSVGATSLIESGDLTIQFPKKLNKNTLITDNTNYIKVVFEVSDLDKNEFVYIVPLSEKWSDMPEEVKNIIDKAKNN